MPATRTQHVVRRINKQTERTATATATWKSIRGLWAKKKIDPVRYQREARRETRSSR